MGALAAVVHTLLGYVRQAQMMVARAPPVNDPARVRCSAFGCLLECLDVLASSTVVRLEIAT